MAKLNWKTPNGNSGNVDLDKIFTTDGGTIIGRIIPSMVPGCWGTLAIGEGDTNYVEIYGGIDYEHGAWLQLYGKDNEAHPGSWRLQANDGTNSCSVFGNPDGSLTCGSNKIEQVISSSFDDNGRGWIKYENGLQILWGNADIGFSETQITFSTAFSKVPGITDSSGSNPPRIIYSVTTTGFKARHYGNEGTTYSIRFIAIGKWK